MKLPAVGATFETARSVTQAQIDAYAAASGDHNPLHVDPEFARTTPLGGTVAHGMLVLAWLAALLTDAFGRAWLEGGTLRIRFRAPARPGDVLHLSAVVEVVTSDETGGTAQMRVAVVNQHQEDVIDGRATVAVGG